MHNAPDNFTTLRVPSMHGQAHSMRDEHFTAIDLQPNKTPPNGADSDPNFQLLLFGLTSL